MHLPQGYINVLEGHKPPQERLYDYVYQYKDHLGNIRLSFAYDRDRQEIRTLTEHNYYPFGLEHSYLQTRRRPELVDSPTLDGIIAEPVGLESRTSQMVQVDDVRYQYRTERKKIVQWTILANGPGGAMAKEWQDELGLNMYAMDMRMYDPAIARWVVQDPVIHHNFSPYNAFDNNPVYWADPSGADSESYTEEDHKNWVRKIEAQWAAVDAGYSARSVFGAMSGAFDKCDTCPNTPKFFPYIYSDIDFVYNKETDDADIPLEEVVLLASESNSAAQSGGGTIWYGLAGQFNAVFGTTASTIEGAGGSVRFTTSSQGISPKYYANSWKGNQYAKTYSVSKIGNALGKISFGLGVAMDIRGMMIYRNDPNNPNAVSPAKAGLNTGVGTYGLWVNPIGGVLYFGVDAFYPGGWNGALQNNANLTQQNQAILGNGFNLYRDTGGGW